MPMLLEEGKERLTDLGRRHHGRSESRKRKAFGLCRACDGGAADHEVPVVKARRLARRDAVGGLGELELELRVLPRSGGGNPAGDGVGVVAKTDRPGPGGVAMQPCTAESHGRAREVVAAPDGDLVPACVRAEHVNRRAGRQAQAAPLADGEMVVAGMLADDGSSAC